MINMEECIQCGKMCSFLCIYCNIPLCKKSKIKHEYYTEKKNSKEPNETLSSDCIASLKTNLMKKIKLINTCTSSIILKTETLIEKIHKSSMRIIQNLKAREQYYISLMNISNGMLSIEERKKFQREFNTYIMVRIPDQKFADIEKFYNFDFLKVIEKTNKFKSIKECDFKHLLKNEYKEFVGEFYTNDKYSPYRRESVIALTVTSDSKYIVSAYKDCTIKIWNLHESRQEAVLKSKMKFLNKILVTSDSKYISRSSLSYRKFSYNNRWKIYHCWLIDSFECLENEKTSQDSLLVRQLLMLSFA